MARSYKRPAFPVQQRRHPGSGPTADGTSSFAADVTVLQQSIGGNAYHEHRGFVPIYRVGDLARQLTGAQIHR